ncbi:hypothetical protein J6590_060427 [Homalodisca vitripennis]|nr:hypothetical protein J6590_060427 [Homalodisca vitripennis]
MCTCTSLHRFHMLREGLASTSLVYHGNISNEWFHFPNWKGQNEVTTGGHLLQRLESGGCPYLYYMNFRTTPGAGYNTFIYRSISRER